MRKIIVIFIGLLVVLALTWSSRSAPSGLDSAWAVFESYLAAAKAHDLPTLKRLSHQISDVCQNPEKEAECFGRMDGVYSLAKDFKRESFKNVWEDRKQIIIHTDWLLEENDIAKGYSRQIIYFTKNWKGEIKVLSMSLPNQSVLLIKGEQDAEFIDRRLSEMIKDSDQDALDDEVETCVYISSVACEETDPNRRDTDGDGWWDGIEIFFYSNVLEKKQGEQATSTIPSLTLPELL